jgi:hypothetical protein
MKSLLISEERNMPRPPTDPDKKMLNFSVNLLPDEREYLEQLKESLDKMHAGEAMREVVKNLKTFFNLPAYQVEVLKKDMASRKHNWMSYLQELLARRYELLQQEAKGKGK